MIYKIEIRNREDFNDFIDVIDRRAYNVSWGYTPVGGCAQFSFTINSRYCRETVLGTNFNVQIKRRNPITKEYDLWYQGRIESVNEDVAPDKEIIEVSGFGYQSELRDINVDETYTSDEASVIVKHILDNYIVPYTNVTYDNGDIEATSFTFDSYKFEDIKAIDAFKQIAEIVGNIEWGVDRNRKFYFKQRSDDVGWIEHVGKKGFSGLKIRNTSIGIVTRVKVLGEGSYEYVKEYAKSIEKYKRRDAVLERSSITTDAVAEQFADSIHEENRQTKRRASYLLDREELLENTVPLGLVDIESREPVYDEEGYDTINYADPDNFRINRVSYRIQKSGSLNIEVNAGDIIPMEAEKIRQLEFKIEQVRNK